jgi:plastocyanin
MRWQRVAAVLLLAVSLAGCSSEKKVGSAIDIEKLAEKNQALGGAKLDKKKTSGGFVGDTEKKEQEQAQAQAQAAANQASQDAAAEVQKDKAAVSFSITGSGYDPYVIRVFTGGRITVVNRFTKPASVTADRGEFDSGLIAPGDTWSYEPETPGKFNFHDSGRPYVVGSLEVIAQ